LGIEDFEVKVGELSGGYCKRIALASALMANPDLLLMDEPTNHLDAESVEWLQEYLSRFRGAILLITHDRYFLDQVTNRILEIDRGDIYSYAGNYSYYLEKKALAEESSASSQQKHKGILRRELQWLQRGPKARSTKQKARIGRVYDLQEKTFKEAQGKVEIDTPSRRIGKKVIELNNISKTFEERPLIKDFTYEFVPSDRIGIIGGNGTGKSTLMNIIAGRLEPDQGKVEIGSTIHIGYFDQRSEDIVSNSDAQKRVIDYIKDVATYIETSDGTQITASQMLERFLFTSNQQYTPIYKLSGGEKRRLFLLKLLMSSPNVLLLDEPTNDLDVQTLAVLEEYIESFNGCVLIVSHDRYFLDRTVNSIFAIENGGNIRQYPGNYSIYLDYKKQQEKENKTLNIIQEKEDKSEQIKSSISSPQRPRRLSNYQKKELEKLESVIIPNLEIKKEEIENKLYQNPPQDYNELHSLTEQLNSINEEIDQATNKWIELSEIET
jgi:ABC transport system ATP-binding/permease protein